MNATATATATVEDPLAVSGHSYPAAAVVDAEKYWWHLARLRESRTRAEAAGHTWSLATAAGHIAAVLADDPPTAPDPSRDPAAWYDLADYLDRLALALDGGGFFPGTGAGEEPGDRKARAVWEHLAGTVTRREFTAAWHPIGQRIEALAAPREDGTPPPLRAFTAAQVTKAAAAIIDAPWGEARGDDDE